jgi:hypothetical protein
MGEDRRRACRANAPIDQASKRALTQRDRRHRCCIGGSRAIIEIPNDCHILKLSHPGEDFYGTA